MKTYELTPAGDRWKLSNQNSRAVLLFNKKELAIKGCSLFIREHGGSLKILNADGTLQEERTFPRTADPSMFAA